MVLPISSYNTLANTEFMLYGGASGCNQNCPSYVNGYKAGNIDWTNSWGAYNNPYGYQNWSSFNPTFGMSNYPYSAQSAQVQQSTSVSPVSQAKAEDLDTLAKYYEKANTYVQKWGDIGPSAFAIAFMENSQNIKHPLNSLKAYSITNRVFDKSNPAVKALWEKNPELMQKAYSQLHAVNRASQDKFSFVQKWFQKPMDKTARNELENLMADAIKSGDEKAVLRATETLKASRGMDGYIPSLWNKITGGKNLTPQERIANKSAEIDKIVNAPKAIKPGMTGLLKQGMKEGKTFALFGLLIDAPKIISAYKNGGASAALTQTLETGTHSLIDGIGWTLGRAAGTAIGTKVGAAIGTAVCPGLGTAVGAVIGFLGGAAGSILASKISHALLPTDKATQLEAKVQTKTADGQAKLLSLVVSKVNEGEKVPDKVLQSANNVAQTLSA